MILVPKPYPREFRDDVVRVARARESGCDDRADREGLRGAPDDVAEVDAPRRRRRRQQAEDDVRAVLRAAGGEQANPVGRTTE